MTKSKKHEKTITLNSHTITVGQHIGGNRDPIWEVALVGVGITAISLPIFSSANKKAIKGVKAFNHKVKYKKALN